MVVIAAAVSTQLSDSALGVAGRLSVVTELFDLSFAMWMVITLELMMLFVFAFCGRGILASVLPIAGWTKFQQNCWRCFHLAQSSAMTSFGL